MTVSVRLGENRLLFSVDDASIREEGAYFIHKLYFAPFLGCTRAADTDGYMLIPDGSGALMPVSGVCRCCALFRPCVWTRSGH